MNCSEKDRYTCNVEKMGCDGCAHKEPIDDVRLLREHLKELNVWNHKIEKYLDNIEENLVEMQKSKEYYLKMYAESNNMFVGKGVKNGN